MNKQRGFTFTEMLATLAVVSIILSIGVPAMGGMLARHRVESAAAQLKLGLMQARSQAIMQDHKIYVSFKSTGGNWSYGFGDSSGCTPDSINNCTVNGVSKVFSGDSWQNVRMSFGGSATSSTQSISFDPRRGVASGAGTITLTSVNAGTITVTISPIGHVSMCAPAQGGVTGYRSCNA